MRVLFLDVDGVLNSSSLRAGQENVISLTGGCLMLDTRALLRLAAFLRLTRAKVVFSTNWRADAKATQQLKKELHAAGAPKNAFVGRTAEFSRVGQAVRRVAEILHWLALHRVTLGVESWVAFDDLELAAACASPKAGDADWAACHMVRTNPDIGLQDAHVTRALGILGFSSVPKPVARAPTRQKGIVLDIDGTLIAWAGEHEVHEDSYACSDWDGNAIFPRPKLQLFLDFCFQHFKGVALWTAASKSRAETVIGTVLGRYRPWAFAWSAERCPTRDLKPLKKVWQSAGRRAQGFDRAGTVIVENTSSNCVKNYGNSVLVPSFCATSTEDDALARLMQYLESEVLPLADVRSRRSGFFDDGCSQEICAVCSGSQLLLDDPCPLCADERPE